MPVMHESHPMGWRPPLWLGLILLLVVPANAQFLDLDPTPDFPTPRHALGDLAELLTEELTSIPEPSSLDSPETQAVLKAMRTLRRVMIELAVRGERDEPASMAIGLAVQRLAFSRDGIDQLLSTIESGGAFTGSPPRLLEDQARRSAAGKLERFASAGLDMIRRSSTATVAELDATLAITLDPLIEVIEIIEHRTAENRWPTVEEVLVGSPPDETPTRPLSGDSPLARADQQLARSIESPELAVDAQDLRVLLHKIRDARIRIANAGISETALESIQPSIDLAISLTDDPINWGKPRTELQRVNAAIMTAEAIGRLVATTSRARIDPGMLENAWVIAMTNQSGRDAIMLLERGQELMSLMSEPTRDATPNRDLLPAMRSIQSRIQKTSRQLLKVFPELMTDPGAMQDPSIASTFQAMTALRMDEHRIRSAQEQTRKLMAIRPSASRDFTRRVRGWCRMLGEDHNRRQGAKALDTLAMDFRRFVPIPFESNLRQGDERTMRITGGLATDLAERIDLLRTEWAQEIASGELNGAKRDELIRIARLGTLLQDLEYVITDTRRVRETLQSTNHWGGWHVPQSAVEWTARSIAPGLKVAIAALLKDDHATVDRDLDRLESQTPPARLVAWLGNQLASPLAETLDAPAGAIIAVALPASRNAWLRSERSDIAAIAMGLIEREHAIRNGRTDDARKLSDYVVRMSRILLESQPGP